MSRLNWTRARRPRETTPLIPTRDDREDVPAKRRRGPGFVESADVLARIEETRRQSAEAPTPRARVRLTDADRRRAEQHDAFAED